MKKTLKYLVLAALAIIASLIAYIAVTVNPNDYKPQIVDLVREETGRTLTLEGDIRLKLFPGIGLNLGKASLSGPNGKGGFASVDNVRLGVAWLPLLRGNLEIDRLDIDGLHAGLVRYRDGKTNYDDLSSGNGGAKKTGFDIGGVEVRNSSISFEDLGTGKKTEVEGISLETGRLKEGGHTDFSLNFGVKSVGTNSRLDMKSGLLLGDGRYELDGIELKFGSEKLEASVKGKAEIDTKRHAVSADIFASFDDSHAEAKLGMTDFSSPSYRFDIRVDRLDADRYLAKGSGPEKPFDFAFLKKLDANGKLSVGSMRIEKLQLSDFRLDMKAGNSRLDLDPVSADLYGGKAMGRAAVEALDVPRFALRQRLSGIGIGPLARDMTGKDVIEGKGDVSVDVTATGNLAGELKKTLNGKAAVRLSDGAVRGMNLAAILRDVGSNMGTRTGAASSSEKTDFSEFSATFDIRNGVAHNKDLSMKSPLLRIGGEGDIDIGRSSLDYLARASVVATLQGQGGADLSSLKGVTVPVRIAGPFDALHYSLDFSSLASNALKSKVEQKRKEFGNRVKDQLLKGIFGR